MSYASIMFRVVVQTLTGKKTVDFEKAYPNVDVTKYDNKYVKWIEDSGFDSNKVAVLKVLNKFKDGLKGFVNVCRQNPYYFAHLKYRLDRFEQEADAKARSGNSASINADAAASAASDEDKWETSDLNATDKEKRKDLLKQAKKLFKEKFLALISGQVNQKDFCLCSDYKRFFDIIKHQSSSQVKSTFGISSLTFKYQYMQGLEQQCKNYCPCNCPNGGICQKDGSCNYNIYNVGTMNQQNFPIEYKKDHLLQFEMSGYDTYIMLSSSRSNGANVYWIILNGWGNSKSYFGSGKWYNGNIVGAQQISFVTTSARTGPTQVWISFLGGVMKVGYGNSYESGTFINVRPSVQFTPRYVGISKYGGAPRVDVIDVRQSPCNGRGSYSGGRCHCSWFYSGTYCETRKKFSWRW